MSHISSEYSEGEAVSPPKKHKSRKRSPEEDVVSLSPSGNEDNEDSLDIKPPQHRSRHSHGHRRSGHSHKSKRHREERHRHSHADNSRGEERDLRERLERDRRARLADDKRERGRDDRRQADEGKGHRSRREKAERTRKEEDELEALYKQQAAELERKKESERHRSSKKNIEIISSPDHSDDEGEEDQLKKKDDKDAKSEVSSSSSDEGEASTTSSSGTESEEEEEEKEKEENAGNSKYRSSESGSETDGSDEPRAKRPKEEIKEISNQVMLEASPPVSPLEQKEILPPFLPAIMGCRSVEEFHCLNRIEEGTYGVVYRAKDKRTNEIVALKRLKMEREKEGFPITSLREVSTLLKAQHPNIVTVREIVVGSNMDKIFMVMDYVEHDLKALMETMKAKKQVFLPGEVKCLLQQLLRAVGHLHDNWILHRDLKTSNLLLSHKGVLKVGDFGLAREYGSPLKQYTSLVVTLWYRAPELLLGTKLYSTPIDMWSVGCIFGEFLTMDPIFQGKSEIEQINKIFKELGTPNEAVWPGYKDLPLVSKATFIDNPVSNLRKRFGTRLSELGLDLLQKFLTYNPAKRITAEDALKHTYLMESPLPIDPAMFPTWPAKSEQNGPRKAHSPKPPSGGRAFKQLGDEDMAGPNAGFHMGNPGMDRRMPAGAGFSLRF